MLKPLLAAALLAASLSAQITVHPGQDLQAAVNAAPDGGWVLIFGGWYQGPLVIENKSIALVGAAPWSVGVGPGHQPPSALWPGSPSRTQQPWCIEARGRREHVLIIHNARLSGATFGSVNLGGGPMRIEGYGAVWVVDTIAEGFDARDGFGAREAVSGIMYSTQGGHLLIERSIVIGGRSGSYWGMMWSTGTFPDGGTGIAAYGSTVQILIALVRGGEADQYMIDAPFMAPITWRPTTNPCPCAGYSGGRGGNAISASMVLNPELGILQGGLGALVQVRNYDGQMTHTFPWGRMQNGLP